MNQQKNILTIDVEDWYHSSLDIFKDSDVLHGTAPDSSVVTNTLKSLELLRKTGNKATFFILTTVVEHFPDLVREIQKEGHEIASHGYLHKLVYNMTPKEFEYDLKKSLDLLGKTGVTTVKGYRAPYWSITKGSMWALDIIKRCGFVYDSSIFPICRKLYGVSDATTEPHMIMTDLWEFPPATVRVLGLNIPIAGGGYLRLSPYSIISKILKKSKNNCLLFYFHPYELDPSDTKLKHKPRSASTLFYLFQQTLCRKNNPEKIIRLLTDHRFTSIESILPTLRVEE